MFFFLKKRYFNNTITIDLTNVIENAPTLGTQTLTVPENSGEGVVVGQVTSASDVDPADSLSYEIVSLDPDVEFYFADPTAGDASAN